MKEANGLSKNKIKYIQALRQKKHRQKYNKFIVEGDKMALELLTQQSFAIELIFATLHWIETNQKLLKVHLNIIVTVSESELKQISNLQTPNQVLLVVDIPSWGNESPKIASGLSLYLDGIRDPGNMGTIIRIADWFGLEGIFCSADCVDVYMPKVVQAAMGAFLRMPIWQRSLAELVEKYPDWPIYGTVLDGENIFRESLPAGALIVIGNEAQGIAPESLAYVQRKICIPAAPSGGAESLNAAVATGIVCALFRQSQLR